MANPRPKPVKIAKTVEDADALERFRRYGPRRSIDPDIDPEAEIRPGVGRTGDAPYLPVQTPSSKEISMKRGGTVKKTGVYKLHKGEKVVPARAAKAQTRHPAPGRKK